MDNHVSGGETMKLCKHGFTRKDGDYACLPASDAVWDVSLRLNLDNGYYEVYDVTKPSAFLFSSVKLARSVEEANVILRGAAFTLDCPHEISDERVMLDSNLLFKVVKEIRHARTALPKTRETAILRHDLRVKSDLLNSVLEFGDAALEKILANAIRVEDDWNVKDAIADEEE